MYSIKYIMQIYNLFSQFPINGYLSCFQSSVFVILQWVILCISLLGLLGQSTVNWVGYQYKSSISEFWGSKSKIEVLAAVVPSQSLQLWEKDRAPRLSPWLVDTHLSLCLCTSPSFHVCSLCVQISSFYTSHNGLGLAAQSCLTLCNPMNSSLPGSSIPCSSPGKNTGVGSHSLLQKIFPTQGLNLDLPHCRQILYHQSHQGCTIMS